MITLLGNRYQVVREIGAGGMGRVFQAVDTQTGKAVAAKIMIADRDESLEALLRFYQEGAVLSTLKHPNIVEVYGTFLEEGSCSIIMELLEGPSLAEQLQSERLTLGRVKLLSSQAAMGLGYAHQRGIIHRDVKPSNIMVVGGDRVKVTDFGIARVAQGGTLRTASGMSLGTPLYMPPEQIEGGTVDARSDIYSLGAVLYQMVAGRPPFEGSDPLSIAFKHVHTAPPPLTEFNPHVPADWEQLILKMLAKDPARRVQTATEVAEAISTLSEEEVGPGRSPAVPDATLNAPMRPAESATIPQPSAGKNADLTALVEQEAAEPQAVEQRPEVQPVKGRRTIWPFIAGFAALAVILVVALLAHNALNRGPGPPRAGVFLAQFGPFGDPEGVTVDKQGNIYVAAWGENRIVKLSPGGRVLNTWGTRGSGRGQFNGPTGVAVDALGDIYVTDSGNSRIVKLSSNGAPLETWGRAGSGRGQFNGIHGVAVDRTGDVYAADYGNNRIVKLAPNGSVVDMWGGPSPGSGEGQFDQPIGVAVDRAGNVYVADFNNSRVVKLTSKGRFIRQFTDFGNSSGLVRPHGVAVDGDGNIYVADYQNDMVEEITANGAPLHRWGKRGSKHGQFDRPLAIWVDGPGNVYVADFGNNRIQKFAATT